MLKIMVVDDEKFIRKGLIKMIQEMGEDFQVIAEAQNGVEALELIEIDAPHLVITDIKMPKMDGITLVKHLEGQFPEIKKVILSGFEEFDYVRESMRSGAIEYLLKPIDESEFADLLKRIEKDNQIKNELKMKTININMKLNESLPLLKEQFVQELVCQEKSRCLEDVLEKLKYYNVNINPGLYYTLIVSIDNARALYHQLGAEQSKINNFILRNIAEESVAKYANHFSFMDEIGLVIVCSVPEENKTLIEEIGNEIFNNLTKYTTLRFVISMGTPVNSLQGLKKSFDSACFVLKYRFYQKASAIITLDETKETYNKQPVKGLTENFEGKLRSCIEVAGVNQISGILDEFCSKLKALLLEPQEVTKIFSYIFTKLQYESSKFAETMTEVCGQHYSYSKELNLFDTLDEIRNYTCTVYMDVLKKMVGTVNTKEKKTVELVKEYILNHYQEDLTLNMFTDIVYVNPNYLSEIFKSQTGESFVDYFTRVRIEKAKELLKDVRVKTYEVGLLVGYEDSAYFSKVFKKVVGVSPSEYRNLVR